jgi:hypothetical protein
MQPPAIPPRRTVTSSQPGSSCNECSIVTRLPILLVCHSNPFRTAQLDFESIPSETALGAQSLTLPEGLGGWDVNRSVTSERELGFMLYRKLGFRVGRGRLAAASVIPQHKCSPIMGPLSPPESWALQLRPPRGDLKDRLVQIGFVYQPRPTVEGCPMFAPAYMGRKRCFRMLLLRPRTILSGTVAFARTAKAFVPRTLRRPGFPIGPHQTAPPVRLSRSQSGVMGSYTE